MGLEELRKEVKNLEQKKKEQEEEKKLKQKMKDLNPTISDKILKGINDFVKKL